MVATARGPAALVLGGTAALFAAAFLLASTLSPTLAPSQADPAAAAAAGTTPAYQRRAGMEARHGRAQARKGRSWGYLRGAPFPPRPLSPPPPPFGSSAWGVPGAGGSSSTRRVRRRASVDHAHLQREGLVVLHEVVRAKHAIDEASGVTKGAEGWGDRWRSCAVVGNTHSHRGRGWGEDIDAHEAVVRLNGARESARDSGRKTTVNFMEGNALASCGQNPDCPCFRDSSYRGQAMVTSTYGNQHGLAGVVRCRRAHPGGVLHDCGPALHELANRTAAAYAAGATPAHSSPRPESRPEGASRPAPGTGTAVERRPLEQDVLHSTGLQAVLLSLMLCDRVSLYGFMGDEQDPVDARHRPEGRAGDPASELRFYHDLANGTAGLGDWLELPLVRLVE